MSEFFIKRPIVAIVIATFMVLIGAICIIGLPIAQYPNIVPPEIQILTHYTGADALTIEQSVAAPIEQKMSGVDKMNYMYSINANNGDMRMMVNFDVATEPNIDQILTQLRVSQAQSQFPQDVNNFGVTTSKSAASPLMVLALTSPNQTYDKVFLANYAYINLVDELSRLPGIGIVQVYGAGQYAMRLWVKPDQLAKLGITVNDIIGAVQKQNNVNPAGQIGGPPIPSGQKFTYTVRAQGRLSTPEEFGSIVIRANGDGSFVRVKDVARIELGAQTYNLESRLNGQPAAALGLYQLPGSNAVEASNAVRAYMEKAKLRFPADMDYAVSLDQTDSVREGMREIVQTLVEAIAARRRGRIHLSARLAGDPHSADCRPRFPYWNVRNFSFLGFSINTLSLFGLVLAIGLVVDDAIVVVEAIESHIERGCLHGMRLSRPCHRCRGLSLRFACSLRCFHPHCIHPRHYRSDVSAICGDHGGFRDHFRFQRAHTQPCAGGVASATKEKREPWRVSSGALTQLLAKPPMATATYAPP